jgi:hypothetical protein
VRHPFTRQLNTGQHVYLQTVVHQRGSIISMEWWFETGGRSGRVGPLSTVHIEDRKMASTHSGPSALVLISAALYPERRQMRATVSQCRMRIRFTIADPACSMTLRLPLRSCGADHPVTAMQLPVAAAQP